MGLHDRLKGGNGDGAGSSLAETSSARSEPLAAAAPPERVGADPYAELKTRVHHACIAKLGPELFTAESTGDLTERVLRAVTEQLALDRTPLTRDERRQLVREITDDILGYGPLEPFLARRLRDRDHGQRRRADLHRARRQDRAPRTRPSSTTRTSCASSTRSSPQVGRRIDEASPMVDARLPGRQPRERHHPAARAAGPDAHHPQVLPRPVHDGRPHQLRLAHAEGGALPGRLRRRASSTCWSPAVPAPVRRRP